MSERGVTIVGGGLAGLALGIALRERAVEVILLEAGHYPRHKVCGEFISGVREETLEALGIGGCLVDALRHREVAWHGLRRRVTRWNLPEAALGLSRYALDARLAERFRRLGGELRTGVRVKGKAAREGTVWAAGKPTDGQSPWVGLKMHVRGLGLGSDLELHVGRRGYCGTSAVEGGVINVCGLFHREAVGAAQPSQRLPVALRRAGLEDLAGRVEGAEYVEGSACTVSGLRFGSLARGGAQLGDAVALLPPFTGNGMSAAFESAAAAVGPLMAYASGHGSWAAASEAVAARVGAVLRRRVVVARRVHPWLLEPGLRPVSAWLAGRGLLPMAGLYRLTR